MKHDNSANKTENVDDKSCVPTLTREEFIKRTLLLGALGSAPLLVDKFLVPPAYARKSIHKLPPPGG